jgi:flagellar biosynthesis/type III secretory pathway M-ring protein FliF/YscJ
MTLIGLVLIALAAGITVDVFVENTGTVDVDVLGRTFSVGPGWIVVVGIAALAVFVLGVRFLTLGIRRRRRRRAALRDAESATRERDVLAQQLAAERERKDEVAASVAPGEDRAAALPSAVE